MSLELRYNRLLRLQRNGTASQNTDARVERVLLLRQGLERQLRRARKNREDSGNRDYTDNVREG